MYRFSSSVKVESDHNNFSPKIYFSPPINRMKTSILFITVILCLVVICTAIQDPFCNFNSRFNSTLYANNTFELKQSNPSDHYIATFCAPNPGRTCGENGSVCYTQPSTGVVFPLMAFEDGYKPVVNVATNATSFTFNNTAGCHYVDDSGKVVFTNALTTFAFACGKSPTDLTINARGQCVYIIHLTGKEWCDKTPQSNEPNHKILMFIALAFILAFVLAAGIYYFKGKKEQSATKDEPLINQQDDQIYETI